MLCLEEMHCLEEQLFRELKAGKLSTEEYLSRDLAIDNLYLERGYIYGSLCELRKTLINVFEASEADEFIRHEKAHADRAKIYGINSKFIYLETYLGGEPTVTVRTWYENFQAVAKAWSIREIIEFLRYTSEVEDPSPLDKVYR